MSVEARSTSLPRRPREAVDGTRAGTLVEGVLRVVAEVFVNGDGGRELCRHRVKIGCVRGLSLYLRWRFTDSSEAWASAKGANIARPITRQIAIFFMSVLPKSSRRYCTRCCVIAEMVGVISMPGSFDGGRGVAAKHSLSFASFAALWSGAPQACSTSVSSSCTLLAVPCLKAMCASEAFCEVPCCTTLLCVRIDSRAVRNLFSSCCCRFSRSC